MDPAIPPDSGQTPSSVPSPPPAGVLRGALSKLRAVKFTKVTKEDGTTFEIDVHDPAKGRKNMKKNAPPSYLDSKKPVKYPEVPRFDISDPDERKKGLDYFEENGYLVVKNALNKEEIEKAKTLFWDFVQGIPKRYEMDETRQKKWPKRGDHRTWHTFFPGNPANGIIVNRGAGQAPFSWYCRTRQRIKAAFGAIWKTEDLLVSFDGFNAFRPWRKEPQWRTQGGWYHIDQNPVHKPGMHCVQGLVSLYDVNQNTGGLTVLPKSQKDFPDLGKRLNYVSRMSDFVPIPRGDKILKQKDPILVSCKAGDLCLWDSRTIHCNSPGRKKEVSEAKASAENCEGKVRDGENELLRLVCYICMTPRKKATSDVLRSRRNAVEKNMTTNHWPHEFAGGSFRAQAAPGFGECERYIDNTLVDGGEDKATCSTS